MIQINSILTIPDNELTITFIRASGPGGQNVNKVASACQIRFNIRVSPSLSDEIKIRLEKLAGARVTKDGVLIIEAKRFRAREQNRMDGENRLRILIRKALISQKKRRPSHPTAASQARRIRSKKRKGEIKRLRNSTSE
jgi:ribosome-associated protein